MRGGLGGGGRTMAVDNDGVDDDGGSRGQWAAMLMEVNDSGGQEQQGRITEWVGDGEGLRVTLGCNSGWQWQLKAVDDGRG